MQKEQWYYIKDDEKEGPFSIAELKRELITENTLVWTEGMKEWEKAKHVAPLKGVIVPEPPPIPGASSASQRHEPSSNGAPNTNEDAHFGYELASRRMRILASLTEAIIITLFAALFIYSMGYDIVERPLSEGLFTATDVLFSIFTSIITGALFYPMYAGNLGHRLFGMKVISSETGESHKSPLQGAARELLKNIMAFLILPVFWFLFDKRKQNLYDKITKTLVVKRKD